MKIIKNVGADRLVDVLQSAMPFSRSMDVAAADLSIYAVAELLRDGPTLQPLRLVLPALLQELGYLGGAADRASRNRLDARAVAAKIAEWIAAVALVRVARHGIPQGAVVLRDGDGEPVQAALGAFSLTTDGLGLTPGNPLSFIQASETAAEARGIAEWLSAQWASLPESGDASKVALLDRLRNIASTTDPTTLYALILRQIFSNEGDALDEEGIVKSATGIRDTLVWKKLYKFQRDGVIGVIEKLGKFGGCILADSVGLGKTFEALAVIKYYELRNDRVLVLCPKRLRDNWTLYKANDKRNVLAADRLNYDVLNHTDLSREGGRSGDIELSHVNWGNYDLVVIDESHNFRNKATHKGRESRYDRLMRRIIQEGVKTRVLMLSATPVNNRLADLKNQISFATEGDDTALAEHGVASIDSTTRKAQKQFNLWLDLPEAERTPAQLVDMLGFDYFTLLDHLTIARSRRHIEKYYGTQETGRFPDRLPPINIKADVDSSGMFRPIRDINLEIRRLTLASYAPLRYVLPHREAAYDEKYSTQIRDGKSFFRQVDREESLIHLLRVNVLKRMESAVSSFTLTIARQLHDVEAVIARIEAHDVSIEEIDIADVDIDDPAFELLLVGRKVKVLLNDVDLIRWKQDLVEDRNRLSALLASAQEVDATRDAKLAALREMIANKVRNPINPGNQKIIIFTAFADTANYLYGQLAPWVSTELNLHAALVTGAGRNQTTLPSLQRDLGSILTAFSPRSKERPEELAHEGELSLLIATDCISEGQNLQDCDWLINYDIHWNPVRIVQRFGRIDRLGSPNSVIQLVNFWPNIELNEYIDLEQRVSGRMVLLDISATGEENLIEQQSGNPMNDLEYRRNQLLKLQESVVDVEDLTSGVAITDLTMTDFRIDLSRFITAHPGILDAMPLGRYAVTTTLDTDIPPGILFCLRAVRDDATGAASSPHGTAATLRADFPDYPLAPHFVVYVADDGTVVQNYGQVRLILHRLKRLALGREHVDQAAQARFDRATKGGAEMSHAQRLLASAIASIVGKREERAVASLFAPGGTHAQRGEFAGSGDFEVVAFLAVLAPATSAEGPAFTTPAP